MKTKLIMAASALILGVAGLVLTFAPAEILKSLGVSGNAAMTLAFQISGALVRNDTISSLETRVLAEMLADRLVAIRPEGRGRGPGASGPAPARLQNASKYQILSARHFRDRPCSSTAWTRALARRAS